MKTEPYSSKIKKGMSAVSAPAISCSQPSRRDKAKSIGKIGSIACFFFIDVGNTNTTFAIYKERDALGQWRLSTNRVRTAAEYAAALIQLMDIKELDYRDRQRRDHFQCRTRGDQTLFVG